jgi:hypothetical protein
MKEITREVLHKALQEPTARELLDEVETGVILAPGRQATKELAARVEKLLALIQAQRSYAGVRHVLLDTAQVERILNGESE